MGTLHGKCKFLIISPPLFIGMSFVGKFIERINAHCTYNKVFFNIVSFMR